MSMLVQKSQGLFVQRFKKEFTISLDKDENKAGTSDVGHDDDDGVDGCKGNGGNVDDDTNMKAKEKAAKEVEIMEKAVEKAAKVVAKKAAKEEVAEKEVVATLAKEKADEKKESTAKKKEAAEKMKEENLAATKLKEAKKENKEKETKKQLKRKQLEVVFDDGKGTIGHRKEMWIKSGGKDIRRHYFPTDVVIPELSNEEKDEAKEYESFEKIIKNQMNTAESKKNMKDVNFTFFLIVAEGQYYVIVSNHLKANSIILDNESNNNYNKYKDIFDSVIIEPLSKITEINKKQYTADVRVMNYLLQAIPNDIYNSVDACKTTQELWEQIKRLMYGSDVTNYVRHSWLMDEFDKFGAKEGEALESSHASPSYSNLPQPYYVTHPSSVVDYKEDYQGELQGDSQEDKIKTAMMLLARAITYEFSTPTNNRLRTSSNTRNQVVIQDGRVDIQTKNAGYGGNGNRNARRQNMN
ncbi:hypothetical protein Tco_1304132 [Tanacetum coccineum]